MPHHLQTSGVGWLVALVVLVVLSIVVFDGGLRGPAVAVTVLDDAVVRWLAGLDAPGLAGDLAGAGLPRLLVGPQPAGDWDWCWRCWPCGGSGT